MILLPTLYTKNAKGDIDQWTIGSCESVVITEYGRVGGKLVVHRNQAQATNVGRANQRTPEEQASFEAQATWKKKVDSGAYFDSIEKARSSKVLLPMLAQKFKPSNARFPISAQRKLNGLRCLAVVGLGGEVTLLSRGGKEWDLAHVAESVKLLGKPGDIFDGEIYLHGMSLQQINSLVKNKARPERQTLEYHLYDMPQSLGNSGKQWEDRWLELCGRIEELNQKIPAHPFRLVETRVLHAMDQVRTFEREAVFGGYEGLILRLHGESYGFDKRPKSLMKWKEYQDAEFTVIDAASRLYSVNGTECTVLDVFTCRNNLNDKTFKVKMRGSVEKQVEYWEDRGFYIGRRLTVRFFERSDDGIPQGNPVGLMFRLDEDQTNEAEDE